MDALKTHATLEQAVEALFGDERDPGPGGKRPQNVPQSCARCLLRCSASYAVFLLLLALFRCQCRL